MPDLKSSKPVSLDPSMEASDDSEDEDYDPEAAVTTRTTNGESAGGSDADSGIEDHLGDYDSGDEKIIDSVAATSKKRKRAQLAQPTTEDSDTISIRTRAQRAQETKQQHVGQAAPVSNNASSHIDDLWAAMNAPTKPRDTTPATTSKEISEPAVPLKPSSSSGSDTIQISRSYTFAGQVHHENKFVPKDSQEARDYLSTNPQTPSLPTQSVVDPTSASADAPESQTPPSAAAVPTSAGEESAQRNNSGGLPLRRVTKRKSKLDALATTSTRPKKINTLEASRMAWSGFVDQEGINDDLKRANQSGFIDKQEFLKQSERVQYERFKAAQNK